MSAPSEQSYLENQVYPTLFPALEELLRWMQTHQTDQPISPLQWLAQHLKRNNPNGYLHHEGKRHYIPDEEKELKKTEEKTDEPSLDSQGKEQTEVVLPSPSGSVPASPKKTEEKKEEDGKEADVELKSGKP